MPTGRRLTKKWQDIDHAIYQARIREGQTWREVGETVGMSFSQARVRFYQRMATVESAEVNEMRVEENLKYDERERHLLMLTTLAVEGIPPVISDDGQVVSKGRAPDLIAAIAAIRASDQVARSRRALNGLDVPTKVEVSISKDQAKEEVAAALDAAFMAGAAHGAEAVSH